MSEQQTEATSQQRDHSILVEFDSALPTATEVDSMRQSLPDGHTVREADTDESQVVLANVYTPEGTHKATRVFEDMESFHERGQEIEKEDGVGEVMLKGWREVEA